MSDQSSTVGDRPRARVAFQGRALGVVWRCRACQTAGFRSRDPARTENRGAAGGPAAGDGDS